MKRTELLAILNKVKPGLANKELIEQSTSFVFKDKKIYTYNDEITISHPINLDIEGAVPAAELYLLLNRIKDEELDIDINENEIVFKGKKFKAGIRLESKIILPLKELKIPKNWDSLSDDFIDALSFCLFSVGKDMSRPVLTCLHLTDNLIESCDNFRLTQYKVSDGLFKQILLPSKAAIELIKYEPIRYALTDGWIHFKDTEDLIFSCRAFEGKYFDITDILDFIGDEIKFPSRMREILERVQTMAEQDLTGDRKVNVEISNGRMKIRGENDIGWFEETTRIRCETNLAFDINPKFLMEILTHTTNAKISNDKTKLRFDDEKFIHIMAITTNE